MSMNTMAARIQRLGGDAIGRINQQKLKSMLAAIDNDYNSRMAIIEGRRTWRCLINNYLLKPDYDRKVLSIVHEAHLESGDTFEIADDGTHWMVYLPDLVETAYLKAEIIRCRYTLEVDGVKYWVYFQGPTETAITWQGKRNLEYNELNYSGTVYIKHNPATVAFFKRFTIFKFQGHNWQVKATDSISVPGVYELEVQEYFDNTPEDLPEIIKEDQEDIMGRAIGKQEEVLGFMIQPTLYKPTNTWTIEGNDRMEVVETLDDGRVCKVQIHDGAIGTGTLKYGNSTKQITVDYEEPVIRGPQKVHPYDIHTYFIKLPEEYDDEGNLIVIEITSCEFSVNSSLVQILETGRDYCVLEIISSKKGKFTLTAVVNGDTYTLPIEIGSF